MVNVFQENRVRKHVKVYVLFSRQIGENTIKLFPLFASETGSLFHLLFSRKRNRKDILTKLLVRICFLPVSHKYKESNIFPILHANRQKNCNMFSLCLLGK
jgi:hypothetical protein